MSFLNAVRQQFGGRGGETRAVKELDSGRASDWDMMRKRRKGLGGLWGQKQTG